MVVTAGLEAACTAAEVGCTTFLFEKNDHLGGLAVEISKIPDKKRLRDFPDYLVHRASKLTNLFIFKGQEATLPLIKALHPNIIVKLKQVLILYFHQSKDYMTTSTKKDLK